LRGVWCNRGVDEWQEIPLNRDSELMRELQKGLGERAMLSKKKNENQKGKLKDRALRYLKQKNERPRKKKGKII